MRLTLHLFLHLPWSVLSGEALSTAFERSVKYKLNAGDLWRRPTRHHSLALTFSWMSTWLRFEVCYIPSFYFLKLWLSDLTDYRSFKTIHTALVIIDSGEPHVFTVELCPSQSAYCWSAYPQLLTQKLNLSIYGWTTSTTHRCRHRIRIVDYHAAWLQTLSSGSPDHEKRWWYPHLIQQLHTCQIYWKPDNSHFWWLRPKRMEVAGIG